VLERFAFVEVPEPDVARVVDRVSGTSVRGHPLQLEPANV
jgi:DbpA RNA binding domain